MIRVLRGGRTIRNLHVIDQPVDYAAHLLRHHLDEHRIIAVLADAEDVLIGMTLLPSVSALTAAEMPAPPAPTTTMSADSLMTL